MRIATLFVAAAVAYVSHIGHVRAQTGHVSAQLEKAVEKLPDRVKKKVEEEIRSIQHRISIFQLSNPPKEFDLLKRETLFAGVLRVAATVRRDAQNTDVYLRDFSSPSLYLNDARIKVWASLADYEERRISKGADRSFVVGLKEDIYKDLNRRGANLSWYKEGSLEKIFAPEIKLREALVMYYFWESAPRCHSDKGDIKEIPDCEKWIVLAEKARDGITEIEAKTIRDAEVMLAAQWLAENVK